MTSTAATQKPIGDLFRPLENAIDLRSFNGEFVRSFFPIAELESQFYHDSWFEYADTRGDLALRAFIADRTRLSASHVLITDGASQALWLAVLSLLSRGDTLYLPKPVFPAYTRIAAIKECRVEYYDCDVDGADLRAKLSASRKGGRGAIIVNSPHNPTGLTLGMTVLSDIVAMASRRDIQTVLDDTYQWLAGDIEQFTQLASVTRDPQVAGSVIAVGSLGKFLCLPGLRLGFLATSNLSLIERMTESKRHMAHASCLASEKLALRLLASKTWQEGRAHLALTVQSRRRTFEQLVAPYGVKVRFPALGFFAYATGNKSLLNRRIVGIDGQVFDGHQNDARYCLAASDSSWHKLAEALSTSVLD